MLLEIDSTQLHGRVAEIVGRTERGAAMIVNGQSVPKRSSPDGTFRHFTEALEPGQHTISIIGSNRRGGTAMKQVVHPWFRSKISEERPQRHLRWSRCPETMELGAGRGKAQRDCRPGSGETFSAGGCRDEQKRLQH